MFFLQNINRELSIPENSPFGAINRISRIKTTKNLFLKACVFHATY
jgi:hypothetical protein